MSASPRNDGGSNPFYLQSLICVFHGVLLGPPFILWYFGQNLFKMLHLGPFFYHELVHRSEFGPSRRLSF